jgi:hypothetical protein
MGYSEYRVAFFGGAGVNKSIVHLPAAGVAGQLSQVRRGGRSVAAIKGMSTNAINLSCFARDSKGFS